jgi:hypothetical protein
VIFFGVKASCIPFQSTSTRNWNTIKLCLILKLLGKK